MDVRILITPLGEIIAKIKSFDGQQYELVDAARFQVQGLPDGQFETRFSDIAVFSKKKVEGKPLIDTTIPAINAMIVYEPWDNIAEEYVRLVDATVEEIQAEQEAAQTENSGPSIIT